MRYNEPFCAFLRISTCPRDVVSLNLPSADADLADTLVNEFPARPHWTKNTREVYQKSLKNLDPAVRHPILLQEMRFGSC